MAHGRVVYRRDSDAHSDTNTSAHSDAYAWPHTHADPLRAAPHPRQWGRCAGTGDPGIARRLDLFAGGPPSPGANCPLQLKDAALYLRRIPLTDQGLRYNNN